MTVLYFCGSGFLWFSGCSQNRVKSTPCPDRSLGCIMREVRDSVPGSH